MFISYPSQLFSNLADQKTVLLTAEKTTFLYGVNITNRTNDYINMNLQVVRLLSTPEITTYCVNDRQILPKQSLNLLDEGSLSIFLQDGDSLVCFSNGYSQLYDCNLSYGELTED